MIHKTDREWERLATIDACYAILTAPQFRKDTIDLDTFFASGESHIAHVFSRFPGFRPRLALDFGCGVGRLLIPLSSRADQVIGVDVSPTMLELSRANLALRHIRNVSLVKSNDSLSAVPDGIDFIHSFLVFQHIPVTRGIHLITLLLRKLARGGRGAVQFPFIGYASWIRQACSSLANIWPIGGIFNVFRGSSFSSPRMEYNHYPLSRLVQLLYENRCDEIEIKVTPEGERHLTATVYFHKAG